MSIKGDQFIKYCNLDEMYQNQKEELERASVYFVKDDCISVEKRLDKLKQKITAAGFDYHDLNQVIMEFSEYSTILDRMYDKVCIYRDNIRSMPLSKEEMDDNIRILEEYQNLLIRLFEKQCCSIEEGLFIGYLETSDMLLIGKSVSNN